MGIVDTTLENIKNRMEVACDAGEIERSERVVSVLAGSLMVGNSLTNIVRHPAASITGMLLGGALVARGVAGKCLLKGLLSRNDYRKKVTVIEHRYFVK